MHIRITSHRDPEPLDLSAFKRLAEFVLESEEVPEHTELSLAILDIEEMTALNAKYRGAEGATDVLSFGCDDPCPVEGSEPITLGDVIIAPEVAEEHAAEYDHTVEQELNLLLVHGILHLLGYSHEGDEEAAVMQERESSLLEAYAEET
ncbi:MAG: rRNA maturation RNase YbeY [Coriobacteriia bacterium]|nr:rRNA maturation RNase YbeY [Coriobacteriia bacterium]